MGVGISELLPKKPVRIEELAGKTMGIDFSNTVFQFLSSIRQPDGTPLMDSQGRVTSHLMGIMTRFTNLMSRDVKLAIILDGAPPEQKYATIEERAKRKAEARGKFKEAEQEEDTEAMSKYARMSFSLNQEIIDESVTLLKALGLPIIQSPSEADAQLAHMNRNKDIWACVTTDVDPLLHKAPRILRNLTISQKKRQGKHYADVPPTVIELAEVLKTLGITQEQLVILSILVGTDYNPGGIKGIGPKKALALAKSGKDPEKIFQDLHAEFDWKRISRIFHDMPVEKRYALSFSPVNREKIIELLVEEHDFSKERVQSILGKLSPEKKGQPTLTSWFK
ncbi:flap endonuclease-1 [Candidatus Woesearchaeota archaeon]|nr:flap endonuclease-1 [Candidatus Woesearchaeota archaeon]